MKKIVAITAFFALAMSAAFAQDSDLRLGFQVSPTFSWMTTDDDEIGNNGSNLGLKLGARGEIFFRENYAFTIGLGFGFNQGGLLLHNAGSNPVWEKSKIPNGVIYPFIKGTDLRYKIQYVEIPLGLKVRTDEIGFLRYYAELPIITLGFKSQAKGQIQYQSIDEDVKDIRKEVTPIALSWGVGGGIEYNVNESTSLVAGINYQRIFTDITKDYDSAESKATMNAIILHLGVMF